MSYINNIPCSSIAAPSSSPWMYHICSLAHAYLCINRRIAHSLLVGCWFQVLFNGLTGQYWDLQSLLLGSNDFGRPHNVREMDACHCQLLSVQFPFHRRRFLWYTSVALVFFPRTSDHGLHVSSFRSSRYMVVEILGAFRSYRLGVNCL